VPKVKRKVVKASRAARGAGMGGMIRARIDPRLKLRAERVFAQIGLKSSEAIRLFYTQVILRNGLPFPVGVPDPATSGVSGASPQAVSAAVENDHKDRVRKAAAKMSRIHHDTFKKLAE
jgi:DNA-damage-inducible protein J